jgi:hypothetical protein
MLLIGGVCTKEEGISLDCMDVDDVDDITADLHVLDVDDSEDPDSSQMHIITHSS